MTAAVQDTLDDVMGALLSDWRPSRVESREAIRVAVMKAAHSDDARVLISPQIAERFLRFIRVNGDTGCWEWQGSLNKGYGSFFPRRGLTCQAHRYSYLLLAGPIPDGLVIDHLCRVRNCVNPAHMEPVTTRVNLLRGVGPSARAAAATECPKGHPYDAVNTYWRPDGKGRDCNRCRYLRCVEQRQRASERLARLATPA